MVVNVLQSLHVTADYDNILFFSTGTLCVESSYMRKCDDTRICRQGVGVDLTEPVIIMEIRFVCMSTA